MTIEEALEIAKKCPEFGTEHIEDKIDDLERDIESLEEDIDEKKEMIDKLQ